MNDYYLAPFSGNIKVISRAYERIAHLPGSKMIDAKDKLLVAQETEWLIGQRKNETLDKVYVTEMVDGINCCVYKKDDLLYPLVWHEYDCRPNSSAWIRSFAWFVNDNAHRFDKILEDGERICGEWMIKTQTIQYILQTEPFLAFDIIDSKGKRNTYSELIRKCDNAWFTCTALIHSGPAITPDEALIKLGHGHHGAIDGIPEGIVYRYESENGFVYSGKYVSHPDLGDQDIFHGNDKIFNIIRDSDRKYLQL